LVNFANAFARRITLWQVTSDRRAVKMISMQPTTSTRSAAAIIESLSGNPSASARGGMKDGPQTVLS
jgi:hypothetical protein